MSEGQRNQFIRINRASHFRILQGNTNTRINLLYLLDSLCETSLLTKVNTHAPTSFYVDFVARDLKKIVEYVVPDGRDGLPNLMSTLQVRPLPTDAFLSSDPAVSTDSRQLAKQTDHRPPDRG